MSDNLKIEIEKLHRRLKAQARDHNIILEHAMDMNKTIKFLKEEILTDKEGDYDFIMYKIRNHIASYARGEL